MNLHDYKKASDYDVQKWLEESIKLTPYQIEKLRDDEILRFSPFQFMEKRKKTNSLLLRLTILIIPFVWIILFIGLLFNYLFTGKWGYGYDSLKWYDQWRSNVGL